MLNWAQIKTKKHIHFVGIGGVSMSALAAFLIASGFEVSGSDLTENEQTAALIKQGAKVFRGHKEEYACGCNLLVYTSAIPKENPELCFASKQGIPLMKREELLGAVFSCFGSRVAVCGMHGKTTATALLAHILQCCDKDPTAFVGGVSNSVGGNLRIGGGDICVAEACEYRRSFMCLQPTLNCFLNIDRDHLDYYRDLDDIKQAFFDFSCRTSNGGTNLVNGDDDTLREWKNCITYGFNENNDFRAINEDVSAGMFSFAVMHKSAELAHLNLRLPGRHNIYNALCAFAAAYLLGCHPHDIADAVASFFGVDRRFVLQKGRVCDFIVDYAHHPKEIECLIQSVRLFDYNRIVLAFQPHTYTRTKTLFSDFARVLQLADSVVLLPTYAAREPAIVGYDGDSLADKLRAEGVNVVFLPSFVVFADYVQSHCAANDVVLIAGAGDIFESAKLL